MHAQYGKQQPATTSHVTPLEKLSTIALGSSSSELVLSEDGPHSVYPRRSIEAMICHIAVCLVDLSSKPVSRR